MSKLLPDSHSEFRSKRYWDDFFQKRQNEAFEWYGDFREIAPLLLKATKPDAQFLVIGCGNSNFSSDLYDRGYQNITNLDFSELVINEMRMKNLARQKMRWDIGDMTSMGNYTSGSFGVVFDKGALDALMSEDSVETRDKAVSMFKEIERVLEMGGKYICITLAEQFIISTLLGYFSADRIVSAAAASEASNEVYSTTTSSAWRVIVHGIESRKDSPFIPFFVEITKTASATAAAAATPANSATFVSVVRSVRLMVDHVGKSLTSPAARAAAAASPLDRVSAVEKLVGIQQFHQKQFQLRTLQVGRFETLKFWAPDLPQQEIPRFTIFVLDAQDSASLSMAVFMVPVGREADYQFTTQDGLRDIAQQANCRRLLAVCCNRPHVFPEMQQLQAELSPIASSLRLRGMEDSETIPFMAVSSQSDWDEIETGASPESGDYVVEESEDEAKPRAVLRRLIFLQNQNFVQTEVRMVLRSDSGGSGKGEKAKSGKKKGKAKGKKKSKAQGKGGGGTGNDTGNGGGGGGAESGGGVAEGGVAGDGYTLDETYLDSHYCAALASLLLAPHVVYSSIATRSRSSNNATGAGAGVIANHITSAAAGRPPTALLIGLGGGALPMALQRYLPGLRLWACDLDSCMEHIARTHFGFCPGPHTRVLVHEGVGLLRRIHSALVARGSGSGVSSGSGGCGGKGQTGEGNGASIQAEEGNDASIQAGEVVATSNACAPSGASGASASAAAPVAATASTADEAFQHLCASGPGLDLLIIDCDSKDSSLGLSAPPQAFISVDAIVRMFDVLRPGGVLYINTVARSRSKLRDLLHLLAAVFEVEIEGELALRAAGAGAEVKAEADVEVQDPMLIFEQMRQIDAARRELSSECANRGHECELTGVDSDGPQSTTTSSSSSRSSCTNTSRGRGGCKSRLFLIRASAETVNEGIVLIKQHQKAAQSTATISNSSGGGGGSGCGDLAQNSAVICASKTTGKKGKAAAVGKDSVSNTRLILQREELLAEWLKAVGLSSDPLKLADLVDHFQEIK